MLAADCNSHVTWVDNNRDVFYAWNADSELEYEVGFHVSANKGRPVPVLGDLLRIEGDKVIGFCTEVWTQAQIDSIKSKPHDWESLLG